jgi:pyruvate dehydrogenase E1 component
MPKGVAKAQVLAGLYKFKPAAKKLDKHVTLMGSGAILPGVIDAQAILAKDFGVSADVWSAPSYQQVRADALRCERLNRLNPTAKRNVPYIETATKDMSGPIIASSDYMKLVPEQIGRWLPRPFIPLGTDGYGMSDTREALRRHFEVDAESVVIAALSALKDEGKVTAKVVADAMKKLGYDGKKLDPIDV